MLAHEGNELYLVNYSNETLDFVISYSGGFQTVYYIVDTVSNKGQYHHKIVKLNEALKY